MSIRKFLEQKGFVTPDSETESVTESQQKAAPVVNKNTANPLGKTNSGIKSGGNNTFTASMQPNAIAGDRVANSEKEQKALLHFMEYLENQNLPGPDFMELNTALHDNIAASPGVDEKVIYTLTYNTLKASGLTKERISTSLKTYLELLKSYYDQFVKGHQDVITKTVGTRQTQIDDLEKMIASKKEAIAALNLEIEQSTKQIEKIAQDITNETANIESTKAAFDTIYVNVVNQFNEVGNKCNSYLGTVK